MRQDLFDDVNSRIIPNKNRELIQFSFFGYHTPIHHICDGAIIDSVTLTQKITNTTTQTNTRETILCVLIINQSGDVM